VVGSLRSLTKLPARVPGLIADIEGAHVDTGLVPGIVAVSAVSLIGGATSDRSKHLAPWAVVPSRG
jgi:hypothetical protein